MFSDSVEEQLSIQYNQVVKVKIGACQTSHVSWERSNQTPKGRGLLKLWLRCKGHAYDHALRIPFEHEEH